MTKDRLTARALDGSWIMGTVQENPTLKGLKVTGLDKS